MSRVEVHELLRDKRAWIEEQRRRQVPRLGLAGLAVSELAARIAARELISALAAEEAERLGVAYRRIRIGGQRTLWGSCSPGGTLSFNWRLVLAPVEVLDYVVVHELCHLRVPNHSRRFWGLVEWRRPHWREQRDWLREHGAEREARAGLVQLGELFAALRALAQVTLVRLGLVRVERVNRVGGGQVVEVHEISVPGSPSNSRMRESPVNIRLLMVPSGCPSLSASSDWLNPP